MLKRDVMALILLLVQGDFMMLPITRNHQEGEVEYTEIYRAIEDGL